MLRVLSIIVTDENLLVDPQPGDVAIPCYNLEILVRDTVSYKDIRLRLNNSLVEVVK